MVCGLGMSLSSAGLATLAQSWIRRYMIMTQPQQGPRGRRIRAYVRLEGSLNSLQLTVDFLHLLLDGSIFTFLAGLIVLLPLKRTNFGSFSLVSQPFPHIVFPPHHILYPDFQADTQYQTSHQADSTASQFPFQIFPGSQI